LEKGGVDVPHLRRQIDQIVRLTLLSAQSKISSSYHTALNVSDGKSRCFEVLGFDILIDEHHRPWLLEVNSMPSLQTESKLDHDLKKQVIEGAMRILDIAPTFKADCMNWFRVMSMGQSVQPLFDPNRESEIARSTEWRQLFPVIGDDDSRTICDSITQFISPDRKSRATQLRRGSYPNKEVIQKNPPPTAPKPPKLPPIVKEVPPPPSTKKIVLARDPPRPLVLAKELRVARVIAFDRMRKCTEDTISFALCEFHPNVVPICEERERLRAIRGQAATAAGLGMDLVVWRMLSVNGPKGSVSGLCVRINASSSLGGVPTWLL
jgi:tubulin polyglutamylase TTLL6/13